MIYVFIADGFEEIEAITVIDVLRRAGQDVRTVAVSSRDKIVEGAHKIAICCDLKEKEADFNQASALIFPGGMPGATNLKESKILSKALPKMKNREDCILAAICAAPIVLSHNGLLEGKKATCYPGFEKELIGCEYTTESVTKCDNIITANGPGAAMDFAMAIVKELSGENIVESLKMSMQIK